MNENQLTSLGNEQEPMLLQSEKAASKKKVRFTEESSRMSPCPSFFYNKINEEISLDHHPSSLLSEDNVFFFDEALGSTVSSNTESYSKINQKIDGEHDPQESSKPTGVPSKETKLAHTKHLLKFYSIPQDQSESASSLKYGNYKSLPISLPAKSNVLPQMEHKLARNGKIPKFDNRGFASDMTYYGSQTRELDPSSTRYPSKDILQHYKQEIGFIPNPKLERDAAYTFAKFNISSSQSKSLLTPSINRQSSSHTLVFLERQGHFNPASPTNNGESSAYRQNFLEADPEVSKAAVLSYENPKHPQPLINHPYKMPFSNEYKSLLAQVALEDGAERSSSIENHGLFNYTESSKTSIIRAPEIVKSYRVKESVQNQQNSPMKELGVPTRNVVQPSILHKLQGRSMTNQGFANSSKSYKREPSNEGLIYACYEELQINPYSYMRAMYDMEHPPLLEQAELASENILVNPLGKEEVKENNTQPGNLPPEASNKSLSGENETFFIDLDFNFDSSDSSSSGGAEMESSVSSSSLLACVHSKAAHLNLQQKEKNRVVCCNSCSCCLHKEYNNKGHFVSLGNCNIEKGKKKPSLEPQRSCHSLRSTRGTTFEAVPIDIPFIVPNHSKKKFGEHNILYSSKTQQTQTGLCGDINETCASSTDKRAKFKKIFHKRNSKHSTHSSSFSKGKSDSKMNNDSIYLKQEMNPYEGKTFLIKIPQHTHKKSKTDKALDSKAPFCERQSSIKVPLITSHQRAKNAGIGMSRRVISSKEGKDKNVLPNHSSSLVDDTTQTSVIDFQSLYSLDFSKEFIFNTCNLSTRRKENVCERPPAITAYLTASKVAFGDAHFSSLSPTTSHKSNKEKSTQTLSDRHLVFGGVNIDSKNEKDVCAPLYRPFVANQPEKESENKGHLIYTGQKLDHKQILNIREVNGQASKTIQASLSPKLPCSSEETFKIYLREVFNSSPLISQKPQKESNIGVELTQIKLHSQSKNHCIAPGSIATADAMPHKLILKFYPTDKEKAKSLPSSSENMLGKPEFISHPARDAPCKFDVGGQSSSNAENSSPSISGLPSFPVKAEHFEPLERADAEKLPCTAQTKDKGESLSLFSSIDMLKPLDTAAVSEAPPIRVKANNVELSQEETSPGDQNTSSLTKQSSAANFQGDSKVSKKNQTLSPLYVFGSNADYSYFSFKESVQNAKSKQVEKHEVKSPFTPSKYRKTSSHAPLQRTNGMPFCPCKPNMVFLPRMAMSLSPSVCTKKDPKVNRVAIPWPSKLTMSPPGQTPTVQYFYLQPPVLQSPKVKMPPNVYTFPGRPTSSGITMSGFPQRIR